MFSSGKKQDEPNVTSTEELKQEEAISKEEKVDESTENL